MMTPYNIGIIQRFVEELWNERRLDVADEIFASTRVTHQLRSGEPVTSAARDPETLKEHIREWVKAFPDCNSRLSKLSRMAIASIANDNARYAHR